MHSEVPFDFFCVLDFESTCLENKQIIPQEIIEFPVVVINAKTLETVAEFHHYVRPVKCPKLSEFCTKLTGIEQKTVDSAKPFTDVWKQFIRFMINTHLIDETEQPVSNFTFVTCGDWDIEYMLINQTNLSGIKIPKFMRQWINIKVPFRQVSYTHSSSFRSMMDFLKLPLIGRHHSGIDDTRNTAEILKVLIKYNIWLDNTSYI